MSTTRSDRRPRRPFTTRFGGLLIASVLAASSMAALAPPMVAQDAPSVVATTEVLGSVVAQLVGDAAEVSVIMPPGANPHSYEASARDAERMLEADVLVSNGLDLEEALVPILETAESDGVTWFQATDHVAVLELEAEDEADHDDHDHGAEDPHFWTDPLLMRDVVLALEPVLAAAGIDVTAGAEALVADLEALDAEVAEIVSVIPAEDRELVTGHHSLGYFAERYGFELIGTVIPSLSTSGEPTARELARLIDDITANGVSVVFAEVGTPQAVAEAVATDSGAQLVTLSTSALPEGGEYQDLIREIATTVTEALTAPAR
jgi:zinc/manganese transport system substrate-binding protein